MPELIVNKRVRHFIGALTCCVLLAPAAAWAQSSTLPPTDIQNEPPNPPPLPPPMPPAEPAPPEPAPPVVAPAPPPPAPPATAPAVPPAPPPEAPAAPAAAPVVVAPPAVAVPLGAEPLAGFSDGVAFLRSPENSFIFFPNGRLQVDTYVFRSDNKVPNDTFLLRRARLELGGWVGGLVYFYIAGDFALGPPASAAPVAPANLATTDDYIAIAPWNNLVIFQIGQYDAPFTLENRTSDKYFDFMERSITVRAFGIPDNKEMGAMLLGFNDARNFHYSLALVNGDGQNFKNADDDFDIMGRGWVAPFSFTGDGPLHDVTIGGSFWTGNRNNTLAPATQTTQAGFTFFPTASYSATPAGSTMAQTVQLRQVGRMNEFALELNSPIAHRYGVRGEYVWRHSPLSEESIASSGAGTILGGAELRGYSFYGEAWAWILGDDTIIGDQQGLEPFLRYKKFGVKPVRHGLMVAVRFEHLDETLSEDPDAAALKLGDKAAGKTVVDSGYFGINYWLSKRFRWTFNYVLNHFDRDAADGATPYLQALKSSWEQEFLFRFAVAL
ncbi:MAG TPA: porin [Polyangia bacterium]|nr:porin [Polyangia bacterium]